MYTQKYPKIICFFLFGLFTNQRLMRSSSFPRSLCGSSAMLVSQLARLVICQQPGAQATQIVWLYTLPDYSPLTGNVCLSAAISPRKGGEPSQGRGVNVDRRFSRLVNVSKKVSVTFCVNVIMPVLVLFSNAALRRWICTDACGQV